MGEKLDKRAMILTAAHEVFFEKGYHSATSEEIAKRAGVGKGSLYQYFDSKLDIFLEMHRQVIDAYCDKLLDLIQEENSFEENLRQIVHFHVGSLIELSHYIMQFMAETPPMCVEDSRGGEIINEVKQRIHGVLGKLITGAKQRGEIGDIDDRLIMCYLMGTLIGVAHFLGSEKGKTQNEKDGTMQQRLEEEIIQMVLYGLSVKNCSVNESRVVLS